MSRFAPLGTLPDAVEEHLREAGFTPDPEAPVGIVWMPGDGAHEAVRRAQRGGRVFLALVPADGAEPARDLAARAGAVDVLTWPEQAADLPHRLRLADRCCRTWERRLRAQERRARRAIDELASTQDLLGRLIEATPNPVMAADSRGRVLVFNRAAERALGYESSWARDHMHVTDVYADPATARDVLQRIRASPNGIVENLEVRLRTRTGEHFPVVLSAAEVYAADGIPIATVGVFLDRRRELDLRRRLEETTRQLIQSEHRRSRMTSAAEAADEINQPLTSVMGFLELIGMRGDLPDDVRDRVRRAYAQLERLAGIVRALHEHSRAGGLLDPSDVPPHPDPPLRED